MKVNVKGESAHRVLDSRTGHSSRDAGMASKAFLWLQFQALRVKEMKNVVLVLCIFVVAGCSASKYLNKSLAEVKGKRISVIRSYPTSKITAINGNTVYVYKQSGEKSSCEIFFEVNDKDIIVQTSYSGQACNSFYNATLNPRGPS